MLPNVTGNSLTPEMRQLVENHWMPQQQLTVFDHNTKAPLTAQEANEKRKNSPRWLPLYYQNPMQSYDYLVYESLFKLQMINVSGVNAYIYNYMHCWAVIGSTSI